jgi:hypothetical protein
MTELRVHNLSVSLDGYAAGPGLDEVHLAVVPVLLGDGERLFRDLGSALEGWACVEFAPSAAVAHVRLRRPGTVFDTMEA